MNKEINNIDLSIIIPTYNVEAYISETLESFLSQKTIYKFEIIIVDDESTDNTIEVIECYKKNYSNISLYTQKNSGAGFCRNRGITLARGQYIYFCDADDYVIGDFIENCLHTLNKDSLDILLFSGKSFFDIGYINKKFFPIYERKVTDVLEGKDYLSFAEKEKNYFVSPCMYITLKDHILNNQIFFPEKIIYEDNYFTTVNILLAKKIKAIKEVYYMRRVRQSSVMTSSNNELSFLSLNKIMCKFEEHEKFRIFFSKYNFLFYMYFSFLDMFKIFDEKYKAKYRENLKTHQTFLKKYNKRKYYFFLIKYRIKCMFQKFGILEIILKIKR